MLCHLLKRAKLGFHNIDTEGITIPPKGFDMTTFPERVQGPLVMGTAGVTA
jgi:hypothetical protein